MYLFLFPALDRARRTGFHGWGFPNRRMAWNRASLAIDK